MAAKASARKKKPRSIAVRRSGIHGRGVFALRDIRKGHPIIRYRGVLKTHQECEREYHSDDGHTFLFTLNDQYVIDGTQKGNSARWINHACQPNCIAFVIESDSGDPRRDQIVIESLRDIPAGAELTYDYRIEPEERVTESLLRLWQCRCGSRRCRGTMLKF